jgi:hypothetical protein
MLSAVLPSMKFFLVLVFRFGLACLSWALSYEYEQKPICAKCNDHWPSFCMEHRTIQLICSTFFFLVVFEQICVLLRYLPVFLPEVFCEILCIVATTHAQIVRQKAGSSERVAGKSFRLRSLSRSDRPRFLAFCVTHGPTVWQTWVWVCQTVWERKWWT